MKVQNAPSTNTIMYRLLKADPRLKSVTQGFRRQNL